MSNISIEEAIKFLEYNHPYNVMREPTYDSNINLHIEAQVYDLAIESLKNQQTNETNIQR